MEVPPLTPLAAAALHVPGPERALVIGCGEGDPALLLAREFPSARVRGVDRSADRIRKAQARVGLDPEGRIAFKQASPGSLPYPDEFFDLVVQLGGRLSPAELARVVRNGGHFIGVRAEMPRLAPRARERLRARRLARHGFTLRKAERAGNGNFLVAALDRGRGTASDI